MHIARKRCTVEEGKRATALLQRVISNARRSESDPFAAESILFIVNMNSKHSIAIPSFQYSESSSVSVDAFELLCCIGQGAYGQVWLCQKRDSRVLYAMKIIAKTVLNKPVNLSRIIRERQLLAVCVARAPQP